MFHWFCAHAHRYRERNSSGVLLLVCARCGHQVPALTRTERERAILRSGEKCGERKARRVPDSDRDRVVRWRARGGR